MNTEDMKTLAAQAAGDMQEHVASLRISADAIMLTGDLAASLALQESEYTRTRQQIKRVIGTIGATRHATFVELESTLTPELIDIGFASGQSLARTLETTTPERAQIERALRFDFMVGVLYKEWLTRIEVQDLQRIQSSLRISLVQGRTNLEALQALRGTQRESYRDGVMKRARNAVATLVGTTVNHVVNSGRFLAMKNAGIAQWQFLSSGEDSNDQCSQANGEVYPVGEGPRPPLHPNCRSLAVPVLG